MRVLYVEDNADNAYMLTQRLQRHGIGVTHAVDAAAGLASLAAERPDAVLMDWHLPDMDGTELLAAIRAADGPARLPVLVLSAHVLAGAREQAIEAGADDFLGKPLDFQRLMDTLRVLIPVPPEGGGAPP